MLSECQSQRRHMNASVEKISMANINESVGVGKGKEEGNLKS